MEILGILLNSQGGGEGIFFGVVSGIIFGIIYLIVRYFKNRDND